MHTFNETQRTHNIETHPATISDLCFYGCAVWGGTKAALRWRQLTYFSLIDLMAESFKTTHCFTHKRVFVEMEAEAYCAKWRRRKNHSAEEGITPR